MEYTHHINSKRLSAAEAASAAVCVKNLTDWQAAIKEIQTWPEYTPQPLRSLPHLASQTRVGKLFFKDESRRFGPTLASFKMLGAPYAVYRILADEVHKQTGRHPSSCELRTGKYYELTKQVTVCVATDGNQGRGLAYGAKIFGCRCVDYIHAHVSSGRANRMKELGAIVIRVDGEYESSVERAKEDARMNGWHFVSSTSWSDFDSGIPQDVMNAYMVVVEETLLALQASALQNITHIFVCGGVGSIAAAIFLGIATRWEELRGSKQGIPRFIVVEPTEADCLLQSAVVGTPHESRGTLQTLMAGLACRSPSPAALKVLSWLASDFVSVPDSYAVDGMRALASGRGGDVPVVCGESSAASMGVLLAAARDDSILRDKLGLTAQSHVLLFGLEGATDPEIYNKIVGVSPASIFEAQERVTSKNGLKMIDADYTFIV
ncbi:tryptophan synthase beta subunit-like PLP-dependent enzyme [Aspergillus pseudocaelatus]|uniref:Tryptophan synthase beta subunit-like PLP-dependent enzyme n=1 Tax=Aspergillus pseudocaelatus TaxID=1825620 RepID=A0ABQ6W1E5_9EURO|nr:tryptophan synthase beta subunit-like PLP-dependent enzyme [Aspergillus pseudocaelatus]